MTAPFLFTGRFYPPKRTMPSLFELFTPSFLPRILKIFLCSTFSLGLRASHLFFKTAVYSVVEISLPPLVVLKSGDFLFPTGVRFFFFLLPKPEGSPEVQSV